MGQQTLQLDLPATWTAVPGIFGLELAFVGPLSKGQRPAVSVTDLELKDYALDQLDRSDRAAEYLAGRKTWLDKHGGRLIQAIPVEQLRWHKEIQGYSMGVRYAIGEKEFIERSFLVRCRGRLYHLKSLVPAPLEAVGGKEAFRVVRSFSCFTGS